MWVFPKIGVPPKTLSKWSFWVFQTHGCWGNPPFLETSISNDSWCQGSASSLRSSVAGLPEISSVNLIFNGYSEGEELIDFIDVHHVEIPSEMMWNAQFAQPLWLIWPWLVNHLSVFELFGGRHYHNCLTRRPKHCGSDSSLRYLPGGAEQGGTSTPAWDEARMEQEGCW